MYINIILFYSLIKRDNNAMQHTISGVICIKLHINADSKKQFFLIIQTNFIEACVKNYIQVLHFKKQFAVFFYKFQGKVKKTRFIDMNLNYRILLYINLRPSLGYGYVAIKINESDERIARESRA